MYVEIISIREVQGSYFDETTFLATADEIIFLTHCNILKLGSFSIINEMITKVQ